MKSDLRGKSPSQVKSKSWLWIFWKKQKSQSHDLTFLKKPKKSKSWLDFFEKNKKVKVMTLAFLEIWKKSKSWLWLWLDFLTFFTIFSFFVRYFDSKKGPNSPKVCLKCKILTKWPFGTKRKRQNVFSRSPSKKVKVMTLTLLGFWKKSKKWLWLFFKDF